MAVKITDKRTILDQADAVTNWNKGTQNTTDYAESTASVSLAVNIATDQLYWTGTAIDLSTAANSCVYVWTSNTATQNGWKESTLANSSHMIWLSDGTNDLALCNAGNDREVFKHAETQVQFQCFVIDIDYLDTKNTAGEIYEAAGTYASFDPSAVTEVGAYYVTTSKALGGGYNTFCDIIRYGTGGIEVYGGSTSDRGNFLEIVDRDRSKSGAGTGADQFYAGGMIREYAPGAYGIQGPIYFGTASAVDDAWFEDDGISLTFEDRDIYDKYIFGIRGNSTDSNNFILRNSRITSAGPFLQVTTTDDIDVLLLDTVVFNSVSSLMSFPTDSASYSHEVTNCTFNDCELIEAGTVDFTNNTLTNARSSLGAVQIPTGSTTANWDGNTFVSDGTGHAIIIFATGSFTFSNMTFTGYADQAGTEANRSIYNFSLGQVTINNDGSTGISYRNFSSSTTTIVDSATITYTGIANGTEIRVYEAGTSTEKDGVESVTGGEFAALLEANTDYDVVAIYPGYVPIRLEDQSYPSAQSVNLNQQVDRNYENA